MRAITNYESTFDDEEDIPYEVACGEAVMWFQKAAEQGIAVAQFRLGNCYGQAIGVKYSEEESYKWFRMAAGKGLVIVLNVPSPFTSVSLKRTFRKRRSGIVRLLTRRTGCNAVWQVAGASEDR